VSIIGFDIHVDIEQGRIGYYASPEFDWRTIFYFGKTGRDLFDTDIGRFGHV
jgi:hypothetical protein